MSGLTHLTHSEMTERWMLMRGLGPMRSDAVVKRSDGLDLSALVDAEIARWYAGVLLSADPRLLPVEDVAADTMVAAADGGMGAWLVPPARARRILTVELEGWTAPAVLTPEGSALARRQANALSRGGVRHPVAALAADGRIRVWAVTGAVAAVRRLLAVVDPSPEAYVFDESLFPESSFQTFI